MSGILYLIPSPLGDNEPREVIPAPVFELLPHLQHFVVEELRTVRRYLSRAGLKGKIAELNLYELNEHTLQKDVESYVQILKEGNDIGLISEAGLPAVADPGALLVELAHKNDIEVRPFVGPSSLMLALMASGLNGQCFAFTGYLPVKPDERRAKIKTIEKVSMQLKQSQIMIETPYRNDQLFADLLAVCGANTRICVAAEITLPTQFIKTKTVAQWKKSPVTIGKRPCVFVLLA
ncbi:MAG: SAM-dependent methyltransferase [Bacteroidales bacterium]|nr:SAM-dependent methyltransferase [Bacteroidales bacterium]